MTRETKIGLLVGLLFIVAFGLVLSGITNNAPMPTVVAPDQNSQASAGGQALPASPASSRTFNPEMTSDGRPMVVTSEPAVPTATPTGPLAMAPAAGGTVQSDMVRSDVVTPAPATPGAATPTPAVTPATPVAPASPAGTVATSTSGVRTVTYETIRDTLASDRTGTGTPARTPTASDSRTPAGSSVTPVTPVPPVAPAATPAANGKKYVVKPSDTLYAIARQVYGPGHAGAYTKILDQNKAVIPNPSNLKVGTELVIPPLETASTPAVTPALSTPAAPVAPASPRTPRPTVPVSIGDSAVVMAPHEPATPSMVVVAPAAPAKEKYVVKSGDTLYKIASATGKKPADLAKINKLSNPRNLKIGQELLLGD